MKYLLFVFAVLITTPFYGQSGENRPKLIVGIVVDQMRNDYLTRYQDRFSEKGFKLLLNQGFYAANHHFSYMPTTTGPGHASVYTGTTPAVHGVVANNWYDKSKKEKMYCVEDRSERTIGADNDKGQMSPRNLQVTTITDELMLRWNFRSKVIGVSLKDRGAILPAGHLANGAYWLNKTKFISSTFYGSELPKWVEKFNDRKLVDTYIDEGWKPLLPLGEYYSSISDNNHYETIWAGEETPVLPKDLKKLAKENGKKRIITDTPHGNSFITEFAKAAIIGEGLGQDEATDFLTISYSAPDYIGHSYGPRAVEIEDTYLKLDLEIAELIEFLNDQVGFDDYTLFLTADHGAADVPQFSIDHKLPGGYVDLKSSLEILDSIMTSIHPTGMDLIEEIEGNQLFFDYSQVKEAGLDLDDLAEEIAREFNNFEFIYAAYTSKQIQINSGSDEFPISNLRRGLHPSLKGDIVWLLNSGYLNYSKVGTTHGTAWNYDTHVPFFMYGKGIKKGHIYRRTNIRDIAPTLSMMFGISLPSGATGSPILEVLDK